MTNKIANSVAPNCYFPPFVMFKRLDGREQFILKTTPFNRSSAPSDYHSVHETGKNGEMLPFHPEPSSPDSHEMSDSES